MESTIDCIFIGYKKCIACPPIHQFGEIMMHDLCFVQLFFLAIRPRLSVYCKNTNIFFLPED